MLAVPPYAWLLQASVAHNFLSSDFVTRFFVWKYHLAFRHWERLSKPKIGFACDVISLWKTYVFLIFLPRAVFFLTAFTPPSSKSVVHRWQGCFQRPTEKQLESAWCGCLYFQWRRNIPFFLPPPPFFVTLCEKSWVQWFKKVGCFVYLVFEILFIASFYTLQYLIL